MIGEMLSVNSMSLRLALQATACLALGLTGSYLLRHRAARAHQVLLLGLVSAIVLPALYFMVGHLGIGVLAPQDAASAEETAVPWTVGTTDAEAGLAVAPARTSAQTPPAAIAMPTPITAVPTHPMPTARVSPRDVLLTCWLAASCILLGHLLQSSCLSYIETGLSL